MFVSKYFLPLKKELSDDIVLKSHRLMLRSGMIKQVGSGLYAWLPLGLRVLKKIENIIREELNSQGFLEILMPTIQPASLWHESGRGEKFYGKETLLFNDRNGNQMLYGPTAEEVVTFLARNEISSHKELPLTLYNIQWKFRDEIRPRFGLMRAREFLMMDSYSFHANEDCAKETYNKHYDAYLKIFARMGLVAIPMSADTGEIGGDLSHEFHILAESGESEVFYDKKLDSIIQNISSISNLREEISKHYAATDEKRNTDLEKDIQIATKRGIEVGHNFYFGTKYSKTMNMKIKDKDGSQINPLMGSYGIGVGRLVAAAIESSSDDNGIIWNKNISPFDFHIINLSSNVSRLEKLTSILKSGKKDYLIDDLETRPGEKFTTSDLIGIPFRIVISDKFENNKIEIKCRKTSKIEIIDVNNILHV